MTLKTWSGLTVDRRNGYSQVLCKGAHPDSKEPGALAGAQLAELIFARHYR